MSKNLQFYKNVKETNLEVQGLIMMNKRYVWFLNDEKVAYELSDTYVKFGAP